MYLAPACSMWLLAGVALVEWPKMREEDALGLIAAKPLLYLCAAAMGFGVNSLAYIVIQVWRCQRCGSAMHAIQRNTVHPSRSLPPAL